MRCMQVGRYGMPTMHIVRYMRRMQGATVLIHGRSAAKVEAAVQRLRQQYSASGAVIHGYTADLSSLASVRQLASTVREQHPTLTTLINNAGVFEPARK